MQPAIFAVVGITIAWMGRCCITHDAQSARLRRRLAREVNLRSIFETVIDASVVIEANGSIVSSMPQLSVNEAARPAHVAHRHRRLSRSHHETVSRVFSRLKQKGNVRPDDLVAGVIKTLVGRSGIDPAAIEDVNLGCAFPEGEQGLNIARCAALIAGLPQSVGGSTVNRWCGSSLQAVQMAAGAIAMGAGDAFIAGGVENMSRCR